MVTVRLSGVHVVRARLKSGPREYHYAWRGGPPLKGSPGSQEYVSSYHVAHESRKAPTTGTLREIVIKYKASAEFQKLSVHTARAYRRYLDLILAEFGSLPLDALNDAAVRRDFLDWRETMKASPRSADYAVGTLKRLLSWAEERVYITANHAQPIGRLHTADRSDCVWEDAEFQSVRLEASDELWQAIQLASFTGLRQSDLIRLPWSAYDGKSFSFRTSKRRKEVLITATTECRALMSEIAKRGPLILSTHRGHRPWTADGLRSSFRKACQAAKVPRTFHDLRRTAATRLLSAGANAAQLAMNMGWSEADIEALKRKYVSRSAVAEAMLAKLEPGG